MRFLDRPLRDDEIEVIVERFYPDVLAYCRRHTSSSEDAQDATQETFLKFIRSVPKYREHGKPLAFLLTIARNVCIDIGRVHAKDCVELDESSMSTIADKSNDGLDMRLILENLPSELRDALELRYDFGLSIQEVGEHLGMSRFAASRLLNKALQALNDELLSKGKGEKVDE